MADTIAHCKGILLAYAKELPRSGTLKWLYMAHTLPGGAENVSLSLGPMGPEVDGEQIGNPEAYVRKLLTDAEEYEAIGKLNKA